MIHKDLPFDFHDATVISCEMEKIDRMKLVVMLYPIFYPSHVNLELTFSGIVNFQEVKALVENLNRNGHESNWIGRGIDALNYHRERTSKDLDQHLVLELDGYKKMNIHCKKLRISDSDEHLNGSQ